MNEPKLQKPGAGLPFIEWAIAKYFIMPNLFVKFSKTAALKSFKSHSDNIVALARTLDHASLARRQLVPRLRGLEDSSRYWSVAMAMQHLITVGDGLRHVIPKLSAGDNSLPKRGTADVKPDADTNAETIIQRFEDMTNEFLAAVTAVDVDANPETKHPHPWFGPLNAHEWLVMAARHQAIHEEQIKQIVSRLHK